MALILSLESSTKNCSVALGRDGKCLAFSEERNEQYAHAERLNPTIEICLKSAGVRLGELDAIAVSKGPGSFTGLRIGVSAAKGLCFGLDIPLIGLDSLRIMTEQARMKNLAFDYCIPMLDARRMEVYTAMYAYSGKRESDITAMIIDEGAFLDYYNKSVCFVGDGVEKCRSYLTGDNWTTPDIPFPSASGMVNLAEEAFQLGSFESVAYFEPYYLKEFIAGKPRDLLA
jgi:tRNA threonylcarbamoyladenosine biosynthesis protein TsaB